MKHLFILIVLIILLPLYSVSAKDFGVALGQNFSVSGDGEADEPKIEYSGTLLPWFTTPLWTDAETYVSAGLKVDYSNEKWNFVPELLRTELNFRAGANGRVSVGRINYSDPLGFIVSGLFDGASYSLDFNDGSVLGAGAWYTGFQYKKSANITMTEYDLADYNTGFDYDDFLDTYFAPSRLVLSVNWRHPGLAELVRLNTALIGQFDLSGNDNLFHSQYLSAKASIPVQQFVFDAGLVLETAEAAERFLFSFAGEAGVSWMLPTSITDRLSFLARFSNGTLKDNENIRAFIPISTKPQGSILKAKLSGLSMLRLDYTARLHKTVSFTVADSYFVLSDLGTYQGAVAGKDGYFLGNEIYVSAVWTPVSDVQLRAGGGVFLPSWGNADKELDPLWSVDINLVLAVF